jgi:hypothetical protein
MKFQAKTKILSVALIAGFAVLTTGAATLAASSQRKGELRVTKECSANTGLAGSYCTITASNLDAIVAGARIFYNQPFGVPEGMLDSDVVLDAGAGNRAFGHCSLDAATGKGLCTFSDGTGLLIGFKARVNVSTTDGVNWRWDGTYSFKHVK